MQHQVARSPRVVPRNSRDSYLPVQQVLHNVWVGKHSGEPSLECRCVSELLCRELLRQGVRGGGEPLALKPMLEIVIDMDNSALYSLTQHLQTNGLKDIPSKHVLAIKLYPKGDLMLLHARSSLLSQWIS